MKNRGILTYVVGVCIFFLLVAITIKLDTLTKYQNDCIDMTYQQMYTIDYEMAFMNDFVQRSDAYETLNSCIEDIGTFRVTYYCPDCDICGTDGVTKAETYLDGNIMSVAVDPDVIPLGSILIIGDKAYVATDTGGAINGREIDMVVYGKAHEEVYAMGVDEITVYIVKEVSKDE